MPPYVSDDSAKQINFQINDSQRLVRMGNHKEALARLNEFLKRRHQWEKRSYERLMMDPNHGYIDLCVQLKDHRFLKDGLHQYRNMCQNVRDMNFDCVCVCNGGGWGRGGS